MLGFRVLPDGGIDDDFRRCATPAPHAILSVGQTVIGAFPGTDGGWMIRFLGPHAYLVHLRIDTSLGEVREGASPELQPAHVEQLTFRFSREDWANFAPSLFDAALRGVADWKRDRRIETGAIPVDTAVRSPTETLDERAPSARTPLVVTDSVPEDIGTSCDSHPMRKAITALSHEARRTSVIVWNWVGRVRGAAIQIYPARALDTVGITNDFVSDEALSRLELRKEIEAGEVLSGLGQLLERADRFLHEPSDTDWTRLSKRLLHIPGSIGLPLAGLPDKDLIRIARVLDLAVDLSANSETIRVECVGLWYRFLESAVLGKRRLPDSLFDALAGLEFGPSFLAEMMDSSSEVADLLLGNLLLLQKSKADIFERLTARTALPSRFLPTTWTRLLDRPWIAEIACDLAPPERDSKRFDTTNSPSRGKKQTAYQPVRRRLTCGHQKVPAAQGSKLVTKKQARVHNHVLTTRTKPSLAGARRQKSVPSRPRSCSGRVGVQQSLAALARLVPKEFVRRNVAQILATSFLKVRHFPSLCSGSHHPSIARR